MSRTIFLKTIFRIVDIMPMKAALGETHPLVLACLEYDHYSIWCGEMILGCPIFNEKIGPRTIFPVTTLLTLALLPYFLLSFSAR